MNDRFEAINQHGRLNVEFTELQKKDERKLQLQQLSRGSGLSGGLECCPNTALTSW
jgi:hypothetical protein